MDINPQAIKAIKRIAAKKQLTNVETILSNCDTWLPDASIDVALLYDPFHDLMDQNTVLKELNRVLKLNGILSFSDHYMEDSDILSKVTDDKLFTLLRRGKRTYSFAKYAAR